MVPPPSSFASSLVAVVSEDDVVDDLSKAATATHHTATSDRKPTDSAIRTQGPREALVVQPGGMVGPHHTSSSAAKRPCNESPDRLRDVKRTRLVQADVPTPSKTEGGQGQLYTSGRIDTVATC